MALIAASCGDGIDEGVNRYFGLDSSPDTPGERQSLIDAGTEFGESCLRKNRDMLRLLGGRHLVVVTADQHTGYGVNTCVNAVVDGYLVDPTTRLADEIICDWSALGSTGAA